MIDGLTPEEWKLLKAPLKDVMDYRLLTVLYEKRISSIRAANAAYRPIKYISVPMPISDGMPGGVNGIINHADGKHYDSKSEFRKATRRAGCYEVGTDIKEVNYKTPLERGVRGDFNVKPQLKDAVHKVLGA